MPEFNDNRAALEQLQAQKKFDSTSDERTVNNVMRHQYRVLSELEKGQMLAVKDKALELWQLIDALGASRELSLAKTHAEEACMWAVKHLTR